MKDFRKAMVKVLLVLVLVGPMVGIVAGAHETTEEKIQLIHFVNSELSREEIEAMINEVSLQEGLSFEQTADEFYRESMAEYPHVLEAMRKSRSSGKQPTRVSPGKARYKGDIYFTSTTTLAFNHGHVGIYDEVDYIVEAPGGGINSRRVYYTSKLGVKGGTQVMYVNCSINKSNKAADYAYYHLRGKPYDSNFAFNKNTTAKLNCSGLVWQAYKKSVNIDLDYNGGFGVYPRDILNSSWTKTYRWK